MEGQLVSPALHAHGLFCASRSWIVVKKLLPIILLVFVLHIVWLVVFPIDLARLAILGLRRLLPEFFHPPRIQLRRLGRKGGQLL